MNFAPAPLQYIREVWQGILNEIKRVDGQENAKRDRANTFRGAQTIAALLDAQADFRLSGDITPPQITANQNDYNPSGLSAASALRLSTDASRNITGLAGGADGRVLHLCNIGSFNIVLTNQDTNSGAANRFLFGGNLTIGPNNGAVIQYDATVSRWVLIGTGALVSGVNSGDVTLAGETYLALSGQQIAAAKITEAQQNLSDLMTANVSSTKHGYAPKSPTDATQFLNGAATPGFAQVKDSDLSTSDIATNNVASTKHGFAPKSPADATQFLNGAATPGFAQVKDSDLSTSDITTNNVSTSKHGFAPKLPNDATKFLDGTGNYSAPSAGWTLVSKSSDEARNTTTTLANDSALTFSMSANVKYHVRGTIFFDNSSTPGFKYAFTGPTSPTSVRMLRWHCGTGGTAAFVITDAALPGSTALPSVSGSVGGVVQFECEFINGANAGTFALQWAQNTSSSSNTTVKAGSRFEYQTFT